MDNLGELRMKTTTDAGKISVVNAILHAVIVCEYAYPPLFDHKSRRFELISNDVRWWVETRLARHLSTGSFDEQPLFLDGLHATDVENYPETAKLSSSEASDNNTKSVAETDPFSEITDPIDKKAAKLIYGRHKMLIAYMRRIDYGPTTVATQDNLSDTLTVS